MLPGRHSHLRTTLLRNERTVKSRLLSEKVDAPSWAVRGVAVLLALLLLIALVVALVAIL